MTIKSKLVAIGALGAAAYGVARAIRRRRATSDVDTRFDASDLDDNPVIISEEVIVITDAPFEAGRM